MEKRCLGCMELFDGNYDICPHCGYVINSKAEEAIHMDPGTLLHDRYIIGKVIGFGGFGVTYLAWDGKLEQKVAIKEYLPGEFSTRIPGESTVTVFSGDKSEQFRSGLEKFVDEAKRLAKFQNEEGIVKIFDSFEENMTAYIVMEYLDGMTLSEYLKEVGTISEEYAIQMLMPILKSLQIVHQDGLIHRDIAPDNIFITKKGECKLIDFGASRFATTKHSRSLTVIVKPGYSPEEQYRSRGDQGPYTDVYALGATLYKMITGKTPPDAMVRRAKYENENTDILIPPHRLTKKISRAVDVAILNSMNVRIEDRTQNIEEFIKELEADPPAKRRYGKIKKLDFYEWPKWLKIGIIASGSLIVLFGILLITGVISFKSNYSKKIVIPDGVVEIPNVEGKTAEEAIKIIEDKKLLAMQTDSVESEYVKAGKVLLQSPSGGSYIDENSTISLVLSSGSEEIKEAVNGISTVPYLVLDSLDEAKEKLEIAGLGEPIIKEEYSENVVAGKIISQSVKAGDEIKEGTKITLVISLGPKEFDMPDVTNLSESDAKKKLTDSGLVVSVEYGKTDNVENNIVYKQSIEKGKKVKRGDKVSITVNIKESLIKVKNVVGMTKANAKKTLEGQGFKVIVLENYYNNVDEGKVAEQTPAASSEQKKNAEITIYVSKGIQKVKVTFDANGGSVSKSSMTIATGSQYGDMPKPTRKGYVFTGWYTKQDGGTYISSTNTIEGTRNITLYAHWSKDKDDAVKEDEIYTISFDGNGGSSSKNFKKVTKGLKYGSLPTASRTGYDFGGWYTSKDGGEHITAASIVKISGDQTIYAHWNVKKFRVTFDGNGGSTSQTSKSVDYGANYGVLATAIRTGYDFDGWYTSKEGGNKVESKTKVSLISNQTLYAHWKVKNYTVTFNGNGVDLTLPSKTVTYGSTYGNGGSWPTATRTGYTFDGWFTDVRGGSRIESTTSVNITSNQTLYAHWSAISSTVTFNGNGGNSTSPSKTVTYGSTYGNGGSWPTATRTGYTFLGWYTASSGGSRIESTTTVNITSNQTLYAQWSAISLTVTFDGNGGSSSSKTVTYGSTYGTLPTSTRDYYTFTGWYTAATGGTKIDSTSQVVITSNQRLYAQWSENGFGTPYWTPTNCGESTWYRKKLGEKSVIISEISMEFEEPVANKLLYKGCSGDGGICYIQKLLWILYQPALNASFVDGIYGSNTEAWVKRYQSDNGLDADGIVGEKTRVSMINKWNEIKYTYQKQYQYQDRIK